jgi:hypothetical protein
MLRDAGFAGIETVVADKESGSPGFQTLLGVGCKESDGQGEWAAR